MLSEVHSIVILVILGVAIVVVVTAGTSIAHVGDQLAEHTALGRVFVGALARQAGSDLGFVGLGVINELWSFPLSGSM